MQITNRERTLKALEKAIKVCGGRSRLAKLIGVPACYISTWRYKLKDCVPVKRCGSIEKATKGKVTKKDLRPDIFGEE